MMREKQIFFEDDWPSMVHAMSMRIDTSIEGLVTGYSIEHVSENMSLFRSRWRSTCTVMGMLSQTNFLGTHYLPRYNPIQEALILREFKDDDSPKFSIILTGKDPSLLKELAETAIEASRGRQPDIVFIPNWDIDTHGLSKAEKDTLFELVHYVEKSENGLIHTFMVPGTSYIRQGTYEELVASESLTIIHQ